MLFFAHFLLPPNLILSSSRSLLFHISIFLYSLFHIFLLFPGFFSLHVRLLLAVNYPFLFCIVIFFYFFSSFHVFICVASHFSPFHCFLSLCICFLLLFHNLLFFVLLSLPASHPLPFFVWVTTEKRVRMLGRDANYVNKPASSGKTSLIGSTLQQSPESDSRLEENAKAMQVEVTSRKIGCDARERKMGN